MGATTQATYLKIVDQIRSSNTLQIDQSAPYTLTELTGGTANFVFRLNYTTAQEPSSIIKHAEPFIRNVPDFAFPTTRMDFEAQTLKLLHQVLGEDEVVNPTRVIAYDADFRNLRLSDGGERTLKDIYADLPAEDVQYAGAELGRWLAGLHARTRETEIGDHQLAKTIYRHNYNGLRGSLKEYGHDEKLGKAINEEYGSLLQGDDRSVCHGDFWPGNVLVRRDPLRFTIVDWEMTRRGNGVTDIGQFAAEAWLLDFTRGEKGLLGVFLKSYSEHRDGHWEESDTWRVVVQYGTHLGYWPTRVVWGNREVTEKIVKTGVEALEAARRRDEAWLKNSPFAILR